MNQPDLLALINAKVESYIGDEEPENYTSKRLLADELSRKPTEIKCKKLGNLNDLNAILEKSQIEEAILGFNKMHKGTDFAAPKGTPIMASGDGKVIRSRWCGGGGNCIKIKHNSTYTTVYAHLSKFARGIKEGVKVRQGQIIGYVGSTGMSTGPHLHYEVIENGKKINSQTLKLPSGKILKGDERKLFEISKIKIDVLKSELISKIN